MALLCGSLFFSRRLTRPIRNMMDQMSQVENGNFDIQLPVDSRDEIGILSQRFNEMSAALKTYINQSYVAAIKQTEAELTALKSQIYPHFLYNTLEIIRMTALENNDMRVSEMIEALSQQIHYLIGPVQDMVSLEKELDIVRKYIYLLNCRIDGKVQLMTEAPGAGRLFVPKLILWKTPMFMGSSLKRVSEASWWKPRYTMGRRISRTEKATGKRRKSWKLRLWITVSGWIRNQFIRFRSCWRETNRGLRTNITGRVSG